MPRDLPRHRRVGEPQLAGHAPRARARSETVLDQHPVRVREPRAGRRPRPGRPGLRVDPGHGTPVPPPAQRHARLAAPGPQRVAADAQRPGRPARARPREHGRDRPLPDSLTIHSHPFPRWCNHSETPPVSNATTYLFPPISAVPSESRRRSELFPARIRRAAASPPISKLPALFPWAMALPISSSPEEFDTQTWPSPSYLPISTPSSDGPKKTTLRSPYP